MVCGDIPYEHDEQILEAKVNFTIPLSPEVEDLIRKCLSVDPKERPTYEQVLQHPWMAQTKETETAKITDGRHVRGQITSIFGNESTLPTKFPNWCPYAYKPISKHSQDIVLSVSRNEHQTVMTSFADMFNDVDLGLDIDLSDEVSLGEETPTSDLSYNIEGLTNIMTEVDLNDSTSTPLDSSSKVSCTDKGLSKKVNIPPVSSLLLGNKVLKLEKVVEDEEEDEEDANEEDVVSAIQKVKESISTSKEKFLWGTNEPNNNKIPDFPPTKTQEKESPHQVICSDQSSPSKMSHISDALKDSNLIGINLPFILGQKHKEGVTRTSPSPVSSLSNLTSSPHLTPSPSFSKLLTSNVSSIFNDIDLSSDTTESSPMFPQEPVSIAMTLTDSSTSTTNVDISKELIPRHSPPSNINLNNTNTLHSLNSTTSSTFKSPTFLAKEAMLLGHPTTNSSNPPTLPQFSLGSSSSNNPSVGSIKTFSNPFSSTSTDLSMTSNISSFINSCIQNSSKNGLQDESVCYLADSDIEDGTYEICVNKELAHCPDAPLFNIQISNKGDIIIKDALNTEGSQLEYHPNFTNPLSLETPESPMKFKNSQTIKVACKFNDNVTEGANDPEMIHCSVQIQQEQFFPNQEEPVLNGLVASPTEEQSTSPLTVNCSLRDEEVRLEKGLLQKEACSISSNDSSCKSPSLAIHITKSNIPLADTNTITSLHSDHSH